MPTRNLFAVANHLVTNRLDLPPFIARQHAKHVERDII